MSTLSNALGNFNFQYDLIYPLMDGGWYHYLFPFLLVYALVLTIMSKVTIFENNKSVRVIISLVFSLFAVAFPIAQNGNTLGDLMIALFPGVTAFTIGILSLYIVAAMMGVDLFKFLGDDPKNAYIKYFLGGVGALVVLYYYAIGFGWSGFRGSWIEGLLLDPLLYILLIFGFVFYTISKDDSDSGKKKSDNSHEGGGH